MTLERAIAPDPYDFLPVVPSFELLSTDIREGEPLGLAHVHSSANPAAGNTSPQLAWSGAPAGTKSYVVTCFDPDAPVPSGFWHWLAIDIPAATTSLDRGAGAGNTSLPAGAFHVRNDYGSLDFGGAAPPAGDHPHRYFFVVHAVDVDTLGIDDAVSPAVASFNLVFHTLARARLVATYAH
jgi:Raf kinase inhibitor-like YbhB/YbcL family protein